MASLGALLVVTTSCSLIMTRRPPAPPRREPVSCSDYRPPINDAIVAAAGMTLGIVLLSSSEARDPRQFFEINHLKHDVGAAFALLALPFLLSAPIGFSRVHACRDAKQSDERRAAEATRAAAAINAKRRDEAWTLTKAASAAARAGDCDTVRKLDRQVLALDAEFQAKVFLANVGIAICLAPRVTPPIGPPPAPGAPPPGTPVPP